MRRWLAIVCLQLLLFPVLEFATTRYVAQTAGTFSGGTNCNGQTAITPATWNGLSLSAGDITWVCGALTFSANTTGLNFGSNHGSSGNVLLLEFDSGSSISAPYFASATGGTSAGGITLGNGNSYITIDGICTATNTQGKCTTTQGTVQNTANGSSLTYQAGSTLISGFNCSNCTIRNLTLANAYVNVNGNNTLGDSSTVQAIYPSGPNWSIHDNIIHDCGWCLFSSYANNDTNENYYNNTFTNFGHAVAFAAGSGVACTAPCLFDHDEDEAAGTNWDATGCFAHKDGLHLFGNGSTSTMDGVYIYNNYWHGDWGLCPTGFVFSEAGGSDPGLKSWWMWNNVGLVVNTSFVNSNGWIGMFSGHSGTQTFENNTIIGNGQNDNTNCINIGDMSNLTLENNTVSSCGNPMDLGTITTLAIDYNVYGTNSCQNGGNCFVWNGSYAGVFAPAHSFTISTITEVTTTVTVTCSPNTTGLANGNSVDIYGVTNASFDIAGVTIANLTGTTFTYTDATTGLGTSSGGTAATHSWQSTLLANGWSGEPHSVFNLTPNLNSNGTPQSTFVGIKYGANLGSSATGNLATLANDTTEGNSRTTIARPSAGTCSSQGSLPCWDIGAFQYAAVPLGVGTPAGMFAELFGGGR